MRYILVELELTTHTKYGIIDTHWQPYGCGYWKFYEEPGEMGGKNEIFWLREKGEVVKILNRLNSRYQEYVRTGEWPK